MAQQPLPDEAYRLGETYALGAPVGVYRTRYSQASRVFFWSQVVLAGLEVVVAVGFLVAAEVFHARVANLFLLVLLIFFALNIGSTARSLRYTKGRVPYVPFTRNLRVYVYQNGLIRLRTTRPEVLRWSEIRQVRYFGTMDAPNVRGFQPSVRVTRNNGRTLVFGANIEGVTQLGQTIERAFAKGRQNEQLHTGRN